MPPQYAGQLPLTTAQTNVSDDTDAPATTETTKKGGIPHATLAANAVIVTWYGDNDPANPQNWSLPKKLWVLFVIMFYTFAVYVGSAIFAYAVYDAAEYFDVSVTLATINVTLFVVGYALGPLVLAPLSEVASIGRNPPYIVSLAIFCILQVPTALSTNFAGLCVLRFLAGFVGSPPLATGGASITDIFSPQKAGYGIGIYGIAAGVAPALAPSISGFAVIRFGWRWAFWELLIMSGAGLVCLFVGLPETSADNILYRRAQRLRKLTGNEFLRSEAELAEAEKSFASVMQEALVRPIVMTLTEPIILAINLYVGLTYAILYSYLESYPVVFAEGYGWNLGLAGLPFLAITVGGLVSYVVYCLWSYYSWEPKFVAAKGELAPEAYLPLSLYGAFCYPICLFWFAWTANRTSWVSPTIATGIFGLADCWSFMPFLNYLAFAYPRYAASALASNDFVRSLMGAAMPIVSRPLFHNLGVDWGNSLLAFITILFIPIPFVLVKYGPWLRSRSRMAEKYESDNVPRKSEGAAV